MNGLSAPAQPPEHVAIIMDGNGRWAEQRALARTEGHKAGAIAVRFIVEECARVGIRYLTLYSFSSENWKRPPDEVAALMNLFATYLASEKSLLQKNDIRLRVIGDTAKLDLRVQQALTDVCAATERGSRLQLVLALSYGARDEIVRAARQLAAKAVRGEVEPTAISHLDFAAALYTEDIPDPDLLIRTSGEYRLSNFLLWQLAYSEVVVTDTLWPDFSPQELQKCLAIYGKRERRFGLTSAQCKTKLPD